MIRALVFDFDGLILETETPVFRSWQELYHQHGQELSFEDWSTIIGTTQGAFNPLTELERALGCKLVQDEVLQGRLQRELELILQQPVQPGVEAYLEDALRRGLKIGLASSSTCDWVTGHLERLGLRGYFHTIKGSDDVARTKPDPALYLAALAELGIPPRQAIALEDSPLGVLAARRAGMFCVAIPNRLTRQLPLDHADLVLDSLEDMSLEVLLDFVQERAGI